MTDRLPPPTRDLYPAFEPADATLPRLTKAQYDNALQDLLGDDITLPTTVEPDTNADGLFSVGASVANLSPRGAELYEEAARALGTQAIATPERKTKLVACTPSGTSDTPCLKTFVQDFGKRVFRRPLTDDEVALHVTIGSTAATTLGDFWQGVAWTVTALLQSPYFLYRVERKPDGSLDPWEQASRLSFFLWNSIPDAELLAAAEKGDLEVDAGYRGQAERLLADPRSKRAVRNFFSEWLALQDLDSLTKDPTIFKHYSPDLGPAAREETLLLAEHIVLDTDADIREFFTTRTTFVNRRLAAIYDVPAPVDDGFGQVELPEDQERRGFLGQVSFLGLHSHPTSSSATERGVFLRENLLCDEIPSPPSNLNTAIPEVSATAKTLRERLTVHMKNPSCAGCHTLTDIVGLGFENFDGLGRFRVTDGGEVIDASGNLDQAPFSDFKGLTEVVSTSPKMTKCLVRKMFSYALEHPLSSGEQGTLDFLHDDFENDGRKLQHLMIQIAMSDAFRVRGEVK